MVREDALKHLLIALGVLGFVSTGCVEGPTETETTSVERVYTPEQLAQMFPPDMDVVVVDTMRDSINAVVQTRRLRESLDLDGRMSFDWGSGLPGDNGPCSCDGPACVQTWVDQNLGCDICAVFVCDGSPNVHACSHCE